jgi:hypothetical protein
MASGLILLDSFVYNIKLFGDASRKSGTPEQQEKPMQIHSSSCLAGPISQRRSWWQMDNGNPTKDGPVSRDLDDLPTDEDPNFRADLVARIRRQIAEGTYGTEEQLEIALDRLLQRLENS